MIIHSSENYLFVVGLFAKKTVSKMIGPDAQVGFVSEGVAKGEVYRLESGDHVYLKQSDNFVLGDLYTCSTSFLVLMNEFFGIRQSLDIKNLFFRDKIEVSVQGQDPVYAHVYVFNSNYLPANAQKILDWKLDLKENPPISEILSEKERDYVLRLGKSSGREIVPIQLEIYRNLMKMGLIVDKGRRLALSKLGKDVLRLLG